MTVKEGYIRISSILAQWDRFAHVDPQVLAKKCELGTEVHACIENYSKHGIEGISKEGAYFESYKAWEKEVGVINYSTEQRLYCERLKITGCLDAVVKLQGKSELMIVDYKTSPQESPKTWPIQACFYHYLAIQNGIPVSDRIIFLKLDKDGKLPKVCEYQYSTQLMNVCMSALNCYRWLNA
jgi:hypothetical protein